MKQSAALTERLERWSVDGARRWLGKHRERFGEDQGVEFPWGGGFALFAGVNSPLSKVVGCRAPVDGGEFERLEEFYRSRGTGFEIAVSPGADPTLTKQLEARGYHREMEEVVLARENVAIELTPLPAVIDAIERLPDLEGERAAKVLASAAMAPAPPSDSLFEVGRTSLLQKGTGGWVAVAGRQDVACACHAVGENGIASLFGGATEMEFRGRGIQRVMLERRIAEIAGTKSDVVVVVTAAGTTSQRNAQRCGFEPVHSWWTWHSPRVAAG